MLKVWGGSEERIRTVKGRLSRLIAVTCVFQLLIPAPSVTRLATAQEAPQPTQSEAPPIPNDQLDSLVAPIALYPDPLLAQVLAASTYPLELTELQQWLAQNKGLKDQALADAVKKQDWDPSVQAMAPLPDVVKKLTENIKWTTDLGNAFLAQQSGVMDAVQRMRKKAQQAGTLESSEQLKVENTTENGKPVVEIAQANPSVVYVPSYNPTVVYGAPAYPYPPIAYPPPGYAAAGAFLSFGVGVAMGAAFGGGWGYHAGWGGGGNNNITINNNNSYVRNANASSNRVAGAGGNTWQHNSRHREGAPYPNRNTANRYGGTTRGASTAQRQESARKQSLASSRQQPGATGRNAGRGNAAGAKKPAARQQAGRGGGDRIGNQSVSRSPSRGSSGSALGGGAHGFNGSSARSASSRGASSMGRGGGGRAGQAQRGGGRRR